ncbi:sensor histidine kinase [Vibrio pelagius]|uniref:sensor histidine kinase n=1 Tax=Vibrio pelagius TaxID=28169 RepID=UPI0021C325CD|nr:ATP-binding protein [Vibrio pelagius]
MKRIYLESILGLFACFMAGLVAYEFSVYQWTTDYEFVLEDYEASAHQQLVENIALNQGVTEAEKAIEQFAKTTRHTLSRYSIDDPAPVAISDFFKRHPEKSILFDDERDLWFHFAGSDALYRYAPDEKTLVRQKIELEDDLLWLFFIASFVVYTLGHLFIIFCRVKKLEKATLSFASGDFSTRVTTSSGSAIGTLNQSFNVMADHIEHLISTNRSLTNAIAHELRTPVFRIQWQAELLKDTTLSDEQLTTIESIVEDTEEMESMVDELLYFSRLDSQRVEPECEELVLSDYLKVTLPRWHRETSLNLVLLSVDTTLTQEKINADENLLKRALDNVIRNAFKFADAQVFIELSEEENASGDRNYLAIHIHDDGPGVDDKHIAHLFDPFYVGNEARNKGKSGHGLGLSIVQKVCEQHDGYITVRRSKLLGGAQFTLHFPKCNSEPDKPIQ